MSEASNPVEWFIRLRIPDGLPQARLLGVIQAMLAICGLLDSSVKFQWNGLTSGRTPGATNRRVEEGDAGRINARSFGGQMSCTAAD